MQIKHHKDETVGSKNAVNSLSIYKTDILWGSTPLSDKDSFIEVKFTKLT